MRDELTERIEALIISCINGFSAELVELKVKRPGKMVVIDIIADKPEGGITLDECTLINKKVNQAIEEKQWFGENYVVEVASPGLDRPLATSKDFMRVLGREVRIHLTKSLDDKLEYHGEVVEVKENQILIKKNNTDITIPIENISKAVQVIE